MLLKDLHACLGRLIDEGSGDYPVVDSEGNEIHYISTDYASYCSGPGIHATDYIVELDTAIWRK